jgi:histidinol-phosphate aminotransferase
MKSYFRPEIDAMAGYVPGEQPKMADLVKLNTNENPFAPSPEVEKTLKNFDCARLRRYPDPMADSFRDTVASFWGVKRSNVVAGNGSDDLLTMIFRAFTSPELPVAVLDPSYSLYPELAAMQNAPVIKIKLAEKTFDLPGDILAQAEKANLLMIVRPNAPTGTLRETARIRAFAKHFKGVVLVDEAYGDFARANCLSLACDPANRNLLVMRTFSKSFSLAGLRVGYCIGPAPLIAALYKVKDSYNVDAIAQAVATAAVKDAAWMRANVEKVVATRTRFSAELRARGWDVPESDANFVFARPPAGTAAADLFDALRRKNIFVRYFPGPLTGDRLRITIGTDAQMKKLLAALKK